MSEIIKTEAVVLKKLDYGDTSSITSLYTQELGRISAIIKGGRSPKSKMGTVVDPLNHIQIVLYKKDSREVQLLSGAEIISHFPKLKEDLNALKYSYAVIELVQKLIPDNEPNKRLFDGIVRILSLFNSSDEKPEIIFSRFFLFFITEVGYEIQLDKCSVCGSDNLERKELGFNFDRGLLCETCKRENIDNYKIDVELFKYLKCLKSNKSVKSIKETTIRNAIDFFNIYLKFHITDFKGIQSFKLF